MNFNLVVIYYNKSLSLFKINVVVKLSDMKHQPDKMNLRLNHCDIRMVIKVEYHRLLVDDDEHV